MTLPDYSEFLKRPGVLEWVEKEWISKPFTHEYHARVINDVMAKYNLKRVIEIGCGTGEVAIRLNECEYLGCDANGDCIALAYEKNAGKMFSPVNIRDLQTDPVDLVFCFGVLKHFGLHEWSDIFYKISQLGKYFVFDMPVAEVTKDDGVEHHHVWKDIKSIRKEVIFASMHIIEIVNPDSVEPVFITKHK